MPILASPLMVILIAAFDEQGVFVPGEYVVGLLSMVYLSKEPGAKIVHDPRVIRYVRCGKKCGWNAALSRRSRLYQESNEGE